MFNHDYNLSDDLRIYCQLKCARHTEIAGARPVGAGSFRAQEETWVPGERLNKSGESCGEETWRQHSAVYSRGLCLLPTQEQYEDLCI